MRALTTLPRVLVPAEVDALVAALHTARDRAMVDGAGRPAPLRGAGLRLDDIRLGERRVFIADGKGGRQRLIPVSSRFFSLARYLDGGCARAIDEASDCRPVGSTRSCAP